VIDGKSTDGTLSILQKYQNKITYISEPDTGIYDAMNKGIELATGDIIGILNSDDVLFDNEIINKVVHSFSSDVDCVYGNVILVNEFNKLVRNYTLPFSGALTIFVDRGRLFIVENQEGTKNVVYRIDWVTLAPTLFNVNVGLTDLFKGGAESDDCRKILCNELVKSQDYGNYGFPIEFEIQLDRLVGGTVNFKYTSADKPTRFILSFDGQLVVDTGYVGAPIYGHKVPPQTTERDLFTTSLNGKIDPITGNFYPNSSTTDPAPDNFPNINQTTLKSFIKNSSTSTLPVTRPNSSIANLNSSAAASIGKLEARNLSKCSVHC
jgi:hypothetical protein